MSFYIRLHNKTLSQSVLFSGCFMSLFELSWYQAMRDLFRPQERKKSRRKSTIRKKTQFRERLGKMPLQTIDTF